MSDHPELSQTLQDFKLTKDEVSKQVSRKHIQEISCSHCLKWRNLPAALKMKNPETVVNDIERGGKPESEMRASFFCEWQSEIGSGATYNQLINALLVINCKQDAESVCKLLAEDTVTKNTSQGDDTTHDELTNQNLARIKGSFASLVKKVSMKLSAMEIDLHDFCLFIKALFPPGDFISTTDTIVEIFTAITCNKLWDFLNYSPVEEICKEYEDKEKEMRYYISHYKEKLSGYKTTTKILDYIKDQNVEDEFADSEQSISQYKARYDKKYYHKLAIKLKDRVTEKSLDYVDQFWKSVADLFLLPSLPVLLDSIHKGCTEITWLVSTTAASKIESNAHLFHQLGNITVKLDSKIVFQAKNEHVASVNITRPLKDFYYTHTSELSGLGLMSGDDNLITKKLIEKVKTAVVQYAEQKIKEFEISDVEKATKDIENFCKEHIHWKSCDIKKRSQRTIKQEYGAGISEEKKVVEYEVKIQANARSVLHFTLRHRGTNVAAGAAGGGAAGAAGGVGGAGIGAGVGTVIGIIGGPIGIAIGAGLGAAIGGSVGAVTGAVGGGVGGGVIGHKYKYAKITAEEIFELLSLDNKCTNKGGIVSTTIIIKV